MKRVVAILMLCGFLIPFAYGEVIYWDDAVYIGDVTNNLPNGYGNFYARDGSAEYVGNFRNDEYHGRGVFIWGDGAETDVNELPIDAVYLGQWNRGVPQGPGIHIDSKTIFIGDFSNGDAWDTVVFDWAGQIWGTISSGALCKGCDPQSSRKLVARTRGEYASIPYEGGLYIGDVLNGKPNGFGVLKLAHFIFVMGEWSHGEPSAHSYVHGSSLNPPMKFVGGISLTGFEGMGTAITESSRYIGTFRNNSAWNGTYYASSGDAAVTVTNGVRHIVAQPTNTNASSQTGLSLLEMIGYFLQGYNQGAMRNPPGGQCTHDFDCEPLYKCVKHPVFFASRPGKCLKPVDSFGLPTLDPFPFGLLDIRDSGCYFDTDCSIGFSCDQTIRACVR